MGPYDADLDSFFGEQHLEQLCRIVHISGARIVLSTTWRLDAASAQKVVAVLTQHGLARPIGATPDLAPSGRAEEIRTWLERYGHFVDTDRWVAIDDIPLSPPFPERHVVTTDPLQGLTAADADAALAKLGNALTKLGEKLTDGEIDEMMKEADT